MNFVYFFHETIEYLTTNQMGFETNFCDACGLCCMYRKNSVLDGIERDFNIIIEKFSRCHNNKLEKYFHVSGLGSYYVAFWEDIKIEWNESGITIEIDVWKEFRFNHFALILLNLPRIKSKVTMVMRFKRGEFVKICKRFVKVLKRIHEKRKKRSCVRNRFEIDIKYNNSSISTSALDTLESFILLFSDFTKRDA
jgi:hypothetical protein